MAAPRQRPWGPQQQPSPQIRELWKDVSIGIDTDQIVVWKDAVRSLQAANTHLSTNQEARIFAETYLKPMLTILVEQQPSKIGQHEKSCVEESLSLGIAIICQDLKLLLFSEDRSQGTSQRVSKVLDALALIFNRKKAYYKKVASWLRSDVSNDGLPELRLVLMELFRVEDGYRDLSTYIGHLSVVPELMPSFEFFHVILWGLGDLIYQQERQQDDEEARKIIDPIKGATTVEESAILVSHAVTEYMNSFIDRMMGDERTNNDSSNGHDLETIMTVRADMQRIHDKLIVTRRAETYRYYRFWRAVCLKLIRSLSLPLQLAGWEQVDLLIEASLDHRPPPRKYIVEGAGTAFVNGIYSFASATTSDGYMKVGTDLKYTRHVPDQGIRGSGGSSLDQEKTLTLFRCTMRSQQKWWFLSDADEEQPGTDRDIDYYQHKTKEKDEALPPPSGWVACRHAGEDPPPTVRPEGLMVPKGQEYQTLEHQLARWAVENKIVEHVFGTSLHREVVERPIRLIGFLASMCEHDEDPRKARTADSAKELPPQPGPNAYCLLESHLVSAWDSCTGELVHAGLSGQICQLLGTSLPTLPNSLARPLLQAIFESIPRSVGEVVSFLGALAAKHDSSSNSKKPSTELDEEKRLGILRLWWAVLMNPQAELDIVDVKHLWELASSPKDREKAMTLVARAAQDASTVPPPTPNPKPGVVPSWLEPAGSCAALSNDLQTLAFLDLFCSPSVPWKDLGESAYESFHAMFRIWRQSPGVLSAFSNDTYVDALWRICMTAGTEGSVDRAIEDFLSVYSGVATEDFERRIFKCLNEVNQVLEVGDKSFVDHKKSEQSAERCLRVLNAAVGVQDESGGGRSIAASTVASLSALPPNASLAEALRLVPHGMRGQACYRRVSIMAKRTQQQQQSAGAESQRRPSPTIMRFSLDVHPLETLASVKAKVAKSCNCTLSSVLPISLSGRQADRRGGSVPGASTTKNLNGAPEDSTVEQLGIVQGCELVFVITNRPSRRSSAAKEGHPAGPSTVMDLNAVFLDPRNDFAKKLFDMLLKLLEKLPWEHVGNHKTHKLGWDLLLAMPTNADVADLVRSKGGRSTRGIPDGWDARISHSSLQRSVYIMQTVDASLQPAPEALSIMSSASGFDEVLKADASSFRRGFVDSGESNAVIRFFASATRADQSRHRMANAVALRILKCCLFDGSALVGLDDVGNRVLRSLTNAGGFLQNLTAMVVGDEGISGMTLMDVLKFLRLLFRSQSTIETFVKLSDRMPQKFAFALLLWDGEDSEYNDAVDMAARVRKSMHDLILSTPLLARYAMPWLIGAIDQVDVNSDSTAEYFDVLIKLVAQDEATLDDMKSKPAKLQALGNAVCNKLLSCPRPSSGPVSDISTGVLCGCLKLLRTLVYIENGGGKVLSLGTRRLIKELELGRWSDSTNSKSIIGTVSSSLRPSSEDSVLVDLMGALFDGFLSPTGASSVSICCDTESRRCGFDAVAAAARSCRGSDGYLALVSKVNGIVTTAAPGLRHKWGQFGDVHDDNGGTFRSTMRNASTTPKYSGLRNQGSTSYMNAVLQQFFMMPQLKKSICEAPIPSALRTSGASIEAKRNHDLVGKHISLRWHSGAAFDAIVEGFDESTGMHTIRYLPIQVGAGHHIQQKDIAVVPSELPHEFVLSEGRPRRETGSFEILGGNGTVEARASQGKDGEGDNDKAEATEEEAAARQLLEEVQRTFVHLEGSRGRCFDPRALVKACSCLKLEFDVHQPNDASEFSIKFLDGLKIALGRWAPSYQEDIQNKFGVRQTKQKTCQECGLKTNREEHLMRIDCQIRGKTDIHQALEAMCEEEYMGGNNKVFCDRCKKKTNTLLRTAISGVPDVLILNLKRFDLDYNTFETVKLNSRVEFGQTLNIRKYTLEGIDAAEDKATVADGVGNPSETDTNGQKPDMSADIEYEYELVGVLIHAGVGQRQHESSGHYYSFIKDRSKDGDGVEEGKWYRFDDAEVTPFDPASIGTECFGGVIKKKVKYPNGQVHTVEMEQIANALMLFYEKSAPAVTQGPQSIQPQNEKVEKSQKAGANACVMDELLPSSGYHAFEPFVRKSNATSRAQTFLFDAEFQRFLKGLLGLCRLSPNHLSDGATEAAKPTWQGMILDMLITFSLDVYMYSADKSGLQSWVNMLVETLSIDEDSARRFVHKLAWKTKEISSNWLRTFLADCPEVETRAGAARMFSTALLSCMANEQEQAALSRWSIAVREQYASMGPNIGATPIPTSLTGKWKVHEDLSLIQEGAQHDVASSVGIIISFLTMLIEFGPRTWKYNEDLCALIRDMCNSTESSGALMRSAMNEAQVPARLIALLLREKSPNELRLSFPGASVAHEVIKTQIRDEKSTHLLLLGKQMDTEKAPSAENYPSIIEALGRILGMKCMILAPLVIVTNKQTRRQSVALSPAASSAFTEIYNENKSPLGHGMGQREIDVYCKRCNLDQRSIQGINEIMAKYPAKDATGNRLPNVLSLEGFLAYYADVCHTQPSRARRELHLFGFRPDLTRRAHETRFMTTDGQLQLRTLNDSVGIDAAALLAKDGKPRMNELTLTGLDSLELYVAGNESMPELSDYLLACTAYERETSDLTNKVLHALRSETRGRLYDVVVAASRSVLRGLASIPDGFQQERIAAIMYGRESSTRLGNRGEGKLSDRGEGLLSVAKSIKEAGAGQSNPGEFLYMYERYLHTIKDMSKLRAIRVWISTNRSAWAWMERELVQSEERFVHQLRSDYGVHGMHDSEEADDSRFSDDSRRLPERVIVQKAGLQVVNGVYVRDHTFDGAGKYIMSGSWKGVQEVFSLFRCNVSDNTRHWYISVVPNGFQPGTAADSDIYSAPVSPLEPEIPPASGWRKANEGSLPPPTIRVLYQQDQEEEGKRGDYQTQKANASVEQGRREDAQARLRQEELQTQRLMEEQQQLLRDAEEAQRRKEEKRLREQAEARRRQEEAQQRLLEEKRQRDEETQRRKEEAQQERLRLEVRRQRDEEEARRRKEEAKAQQRLDEERDRAAAEAQRHHQEQLQPFLATLERARELERARTTGQSSSSRARLLAERQSLKETIASTTGKYDMSSIQARRSAKPRLQELDRLLSSDDNALYPTQDELQKEKKSLEQSIDALISLELDDDTAIPILEGLSTALEAVNGRIKKEQEEADHPSSTNLGARQGQNVSQGIQQSRERLSLVMDDGSLDPVEVSIEYLRFCTNDFQQEALGAGGFGFVFRGTDPELKREFAVKRIEMPLNDLNRLQVAKKSVKKEIATLMRFRHPNIIALYGTNLSRSTTQYLVYELAEKGSIADFLRTEQGRAQLSSGTRLGAIFQTCRAVNFLHTGGCDNITVFHRDVKSDNICLTAKDIAKLIDCGVAKFVAKEDDELHTSRSINTVMTTAGKVRSLGTRGYMDLGYASGIRDFDAACDVFSIGITMAELITGTMQMTTLGDFCSRYSFDLDQQQSDHRDGWHDLKSDADVLVEWDDEMLTELSKLAVQCMRQSRAERPTMANVVQKLCWLCHQEHLGNVHPASTVVIPAASSAVPNAPRCSLCNRGSEGVRCSDGHFTCIECLEDAVRCAMMHNHRTSDGRTTTTATTEIRCPFASCTSAPFQDHMLFGKVSLDLYRNLMQERSLCGAMNGAFAHMMELLEGLSLEMCQGFAQMNKNFDVVQMTLKQNIQVQEVLLKKISGGLNRSLQALAYVTAGETAKCPRLVWLVPARTDDGAALSRNPTEWAQSLFLKKYHLYLICQHSMTSVNPPLEISVHRKWLVQAAPALKASLMVLGTAATMLSGGLPFPIPSIVESALQLQMENQFVGELLTDAARAALEKCESSIFHGNEEVIDEQSREIQELVGAAFRLIAEKANKPKRSHWKKKMMPVVNAEGTTIWVKKEYQGHYM